MLSLRFLCSQLEPYVIRSIPDDIPDSCPHHLEFLDEQTELYADRLYLGTADQAPLLSDAQAQPGVVVLIASAAAEDMNFAPAPGITMLLFSCPQARIHNLISRLTRSAELQQQKHRSIIEQGGDLHDVLAAAAWEVSGRATLLDAHGHIVASAGILEHSWLDKELSATGTLSRASLSRLFPSGSPADCCRQLCLPEDSTALYGRRIVHNRDIAFLLLVETDGPTPTQDLCFLCNCIAEELRQDLFSQSLVRWDPLSQEFQRCWKNIMDRRLINRSEIRSALAHLPLPVLKYNRILLVSLRGEGNNISYPLLLSRLRDFFPQTNMTVYQGDILILLSYAERTFDSTALEQDPVLQDFLERYNAIMMIGNGTKNDEGLGSVYLLCKRTSELAWLLREDKKQRIFLSENYLIYSIIDLCVQRYLSNEINRDILYLTHPAIPLLTRHDREHNTDLRDVLFYYLLHDCNVISTANAMYMHRNTVNNKVNQIKKLTSLQLDDPRLRQRLLISCQIMRYYEVILQMEMQ